MGGVYDASVRNSITYVALLCFNREYKNFNFSVPIHGL